MAYRILFATGGSGGHVYPVVAVAREVRQLAVQSGREVEMEIVGSSSFFGDIPADLNIPVRRTLDAKLRRYFSLLNFLDFLKMPVVLLQSFFYVFRFMPDVVFAKGSYASVMPALAARAFFIPVYIHETDSVPGLANKILARFAKKIFISFEATNKYFGQYRTELVGDPIRSEILGGDKMEALKLFQLRGQKPVVLILGGSQGAQKINDIVLDSLINLVGPYEIIHQVGRDNYQAVSTQIEQIKKDGANTYGPAITDNYRIYPFLSPQEYRLGFAAADVIVSRAGGGSLFEIAAVGKPAVIIPLSTAAGNHQFHNAAEFSKYGAQMVDEQNLTSHLFVQAIVSAYSNSAEISEKIKAFAKLDAAQRIAVELLQK